MPEPATTPAPAPAAVPDRRPTTLGSVTSGAQLVADARTQAATLLEPMGDRWRHTIAVSARAATTAARLGVDTNLAEAAAWLHDIGYAQAIAVTGFHPLDGAEHITRLGWPARIAGLIAYHSGARYVAALRGLSARLSAFVDEEGLLSDTLTYADQTTGPRGEPMTFEQRHAEMLHRHGPDSWNAKADHIRGPFLRDLVARIDHLRQRDRHKGKPVPLIDHLGPR